MAEGMEGCKKKLEIKITGTVKIRFLFIFFMNNRATARVAPTDNKDFFCRAIFCKNMPLVLAISDTIVYNNTVRTNLRPLKRKFRRKLNYVSFS